MGLSGRIIKVHGVGFGVLLLVGYGGCVSGPPPKGAAPKSASKVGRSSSAVGGSRPAWDLGNGPKVVSPRCGKSSKHPFNLQAPHPRIWLTNERLGRLRRLKERSAAPWQALVAAAEHRGNNLPQATASALIYAVTGKIRWAKRAKAIVLAFAKKHPALYPGDFKDQYRGLGQALPLVYDWIHDQLSSLEKQQLIRCMAGGADYDINHRKNHGTDSDAVIGGAKTTLLIALATAGEYAKAAAYRKHALYRWEQGVSDWLGFPQPIKGYLRHSLGGVWPEGNKYSPDTLSYVFQIVEAEYGASGRDLLCEFDQETGRNFAADVILTVLHTLMPGVEDGFTYADAESPDWPVQLDRWGYALVHAVDRIPQSPHARWAQHFILNVRGRHAGKGSYLSAFAGEYNSAIHALPFYRADVKPQSLGSLPLTHVAPGPGFIYARSENGPNASGVLLQGGSIHRLDHVHFDSGSFQLYRKGEWLTREVRGYGLWAHISAAHNTIILRGYGPQEPGSFEWGRARLAAHCANDDFVYGASDLTQTYNIDKARNRDKPTIKDAGQEVSRQWVFIKPQGWLVVFDRIETRSASQSKMLTFQLMSKPKRAGNVSYSRSLAGSNAHGARQVFGPQGLALTTVYPKQGVRYRVLDGRIYYKTKRPEVHVAYPAPTWEIHPSERRWHLELTISPGQKRAYAMHVLAGFDRGQKPPKVMAIPAGQGMMGVTIGSGEDQVKVTLKAKGSMGGTFSLRGKQRSLTRCR